MEWIAHARWSRVSEPRVGPQRQSQGAAQGRPVRWSLALARELTSRHEPVLLGGLAQQLTGSNGEGVRLQLVHNTKIRRLGPLRAVKVIAGEVYLPLLDAVPDAVVDLHDRVAEEDGLLYPYRIGAAELILEGDRNSNARSVGLVASVVVEVLRKFEAAD